MLREEVTLLAAGIETTLGTAVTLDADDAVFNAIDVTFEPSVGYLRRRGQAGAGLITGKTYQKLGKASFKVELSGGSSTNPKPAWAAILLPACRYINASGHIFTRSILPEANVATADRPRSITLCRWEDGRKKTIYGAMGTFTIEGSASEAVYLNFEFTGLWAEPADEAVPSWTPPSVDPQILENATVLLGGSGGLTPIVSRFSYNLGANVAPRKSAASASGYSHCRVTGDEPKLELEHEAVLVASYNLANKLLANLPLNLSFQIGSTAGKRCTLSALNDSDSGQVQLTNIKDAKADGIILDGGQYDCNGKCLKITFS